LRPCNALRSRDARNPLRPCDTRSPRRSNRPSNALNAASPLRCQQRPVTRRRPRLLPQIEHRNRHITRSAIGHHVACPVVRRRAVRSLIDQSRCPRRSGRSSQSCDAGGSIQAVRPARTRRPDSTRSSTCTCAPTRRKHRPGARRNTRRIPMIACNQRHPSRTLPQNAIPLCIVGRRAISPLKAQSDRPSGSLQTHRTRCTGCTRHSLDSLSPALPRNTLRSRRPNHSGRPRQANRTRNTLRSCRPSRARRPRRSLRRQCSPIARA
jgi:hypothetical protein